MRTSHTRTLVVALVAFAVATAAALLVMRGGDGGSSHGTGPSSGSSVSGKDGGSAAVATSDIWKVGDTWTVKVRQDAGAITPDGAKSVATVPFRFAVVDAPKGDGGTWKLTVKQDGAEGPFAAGWRLEYRAEGDKLVLHRVAVGKEPALEAQLASIVLGPQFPYETEYTAAPKDTTLDAAKLLERSTLPPQDLPGGEGGGTSGARPPAQAPKLDDGGAPAGAPAAG